MRELDAEMRQAVISLLAQGLIRPHEAAKLAGVSLQVVNYWIVESGVDWQKVRQHVIKRLYRRHYRKAARRNVP